MLENEGVITQKHQGIKEGGWQTETPGLTNGKGNKEGGCVRERSGQRIALSFIQHQGTDDLKENGEQDTEKGVLRKCKSQNSTLGLKDL